MTREKRRIRLHQDSSMTALKGRPHGNTITLEEDWPPLEGREVRVLIEAVEERDPRLSAEEQRRLWKQWVARGPQGPIGNDGEPEFP